jgi:hypothetical protein
MTTITKHDKKTENALISDAIEVLFKNLGPEKTVRFWNTIAPGTKNYLRIRPKLLAGKDDKILDREIRKFNRR